MMNAIIPEFSTGEIPPKATTDRTNAARVKKYQKTAKGKATERVMALNRYDRRPIVAWDGEGITKDDGKHYYTLFACMSESDMEYRYIQDDLGLDWYQLRDFMLEQLARYPKSLHVIYGGNYDFNMILHTVPLATAERIYKTGHARFENLVLRWRQSRQFGIKIRGAKQSLTIHDTVSFFQCSFVQACDEYLGTDWFERDRIIEDKLKRGTFTVEDNANVLTYNRAELINLIALIRELRQRLARVNLRPPQFDGPGSIAAALMRRESTPKAMAQCPPAVAQAARYAYAGGRFEIIRYGWFDIAHEYDVQSAYPSAMRHVPNLAEGRWVYHSGDDITALSDFSLVHIQTHATNPHYPGPMLARAHNGTVSYPMESDNWIWGPEYGAIYEWATAGYGTFTILESWEYVPIDYEDKPFRFITDIYAQRMELKARGDGAQVALKLAINSITGKAAQQLGAYYDGQEWHIPRYHQLEWAGYTTASCRALVLRAALTNMDAVIAFETDAIFTSEPLDVPVSTNLGDFKHIQFDALTYVQSGVYAYKQDDEWHIKSRGIDRGNLTVDMIDHGLINCTKIPATLTRFIMLGSALRNGIDEWCTWKTSPKNLNPGPSGKRMHDDFQCITCTKYGYIKGIHETVCPHEGMQYSQEFPVQWINPNPAMNALDELRHESNEWD